MFNDLTTSLQVVHQDLKDIKLFAFRVTLFSDWATLSDRLENGYLYLVNGGNSGGEQVLLTIILSQGEVSKKEWYKIKAQMSLKNILPVTEHAKQLLNYLEEQIKNGNNA